MRQFFVYVLASRSRRLYIGVTNNLLRRLYEHRDGRCEFTRRYRISRLVYFEATQDVRSAIAREKALKGWRRSRKIALVNATNPAWEDLAAGWLPEEADPSVADARSG
jgi:putative endonuclease